MGILHDEDMNMDQAAPRPDIPNDIYEVYQDLISGTVDALPTDDLLQRLVWAREQGRPLRAKLGVDPTAPDIHLGHTVILRKLAQFQKHGHTAVLIIGDYTAKVGTPPAAPSYGHGCRMRRSTSTPPLMWSRRPKSWIWSGRKSYATANGCLRCAWTKC